MFKENVKYDVYTNHGHRQGYADTIEFPDGVGPIVINKVGGGMRILSPGTFDDFNCDVVSEKEMEMARNEQLI